MSLNMNQARNLRPVVEVDKVPETLYRKLTREQVVERIRVELIGDKYGDRARAAERYRVAPTVINDVLSGRRSPLPDMMRDLGIEQMFAVKFEE